MRTWRKIVQRSWPDYIAVVVLVIITLALRRATSPSQRLIDKDLLQHLGYPLRAKAIPDWLLGTCWIIPAAVIIAAAVFGSLDVFRAHEHCVSFITSHSLAVLISVGCRRLVGRPRPDFLHRCFNGRILDEVLADDSNFVGSPYTTAFEPVCTGPKDLVQGGYTSFPSTTAAISMANGLYVTLFLTHFWHVYSGRGRSFRLLVALVPVVLGLWMSVIPYTDYSQNASDAAVGMAIGVCISLFFFYQAHLAQQEPPELEEPPAEAEADAHANVRSAEGPSADAVAPVNGASAAGPSHQEVQMRDMYVAAEVARTGKQNPFA